MEPTCTPVETSRAAAAVSSMIGKVQTSAVGIPVVPSPGPAEGTASAIARTPMEANGRTTEASRVPYSARNHSRAITSATTAVGGSAAYANIRRRRGRQLREPALTP